MSKINGQILEDFDPCDYFTGDVDKPLHEHDFIQVDVLDQVRIYYKVREPGPGQERIGFDWVVLEWSLDSTDWDPEASRCKVLCYGQAAFDGTRHFWFEEMYTSYMDPSVMSVLFERVHELQLKHCWDYNPEMGENLRLAVVQ